MLTASVNGHCRRIVTYAWRMREGLEAQHGRYRTVCVPEELVTQLVCDPVACVVAVACAVACRAELSV
jgi:hypothetical protein